MKKNNCKLCKKDKVQTQFNGACSMACHSVFVLNEIEAKR